MTDSTDELMKSYDVIRSIVMRHSRYDAARILTLNGSQRASRKRAIKTKQRYSHALPTPFARLATP